MNDWPEGWTSEGTDRYGRGSHGTEPEGARSMPHVRPPRQGGDQSHSEPPLPPGMSPRGTVPRQQPPPPRASDDQPVYGDGYPPAGGPDDGYNTGQVYGAGQGGGRGGGTRAKKPPNWRKRIVIGLVTVVVLVLGVSIGTYFWADSKLRREVDLSDVADRPSGGKGTNYLIVGSDSREGLSDQDKKDLHTGSADGRRTDSMMILHVGDHGNTMVSLPRDSWITIPEFTGSDSGRRIPEQQQKLNASFSIQGPELLVRTIEYNTGLRIDHYAEIGFAGFANIVDSVGGVHMCLDKDIKDKNSGADLKKGCQDLDGKQSLAFVRQRYQEAEGDLGRTKNQQKFLSALASQVATPSTIINPFKLYPTMGAGLDSLIVDKDMSLWNLASMFWAMKGVSGGDGKQMNMPVANPGYSTPKGSAVLWDMPKVKELTKQLRNDDKVTVSDH